MRKMKEHVQYYQRQSVAVDAASNYFRDCSRSIIESDQLADCVINVEHVP